MANASRIPELLAPAGNMACLHAAVSAGADAVYLGLDEFNARRNADNFTLDSLPGACDYAHMRGVSIYITMNIEIMPSELDRAIETAREALRAGADAFIVQDIGLACELARLLPQANVHISTQMNVHNAAGVAAAACLGARRITLARELSLPEIAELAAIAADFGIEVECFAHGALCVCYSGQCLMSSMIGGRSANRGLCAQACRLPYELHREGREGALPSEGEHLLSPKDLCSIDLLEDLAAAGVASLKIEGRMKSPEYVHAVVSVYREVLDCGGSASDAQKARLAEAFSRGFTTAYLEGRRGNDIMSYGRPNNRGVFVGRVMRVDGSFAEISSSEPLHVGDMLEIWTNRGHFAVPVDNVSAGRDGLMRLPVERAVGKGDRVFRIRNAALAFEDDPLEPRIPVCGKITLKVGEPAHASFSPDGASSDCPASLRRLLDTAATAPTGHATGPLVEPARTRSITRQDVVDHVDRLGQTPYALRSLSVDLDDNVGMGFSQIHRLRTAALDALTASLLASYRDEPLPSIRLDDAGRHGDEPVKAEAKTASAPRHASGRRPEGAARSSECAVVAWASNPSCARAAKRAGADDVYVPIVNFRRGQAQLLGVRQESAEQAGYPKQCIMALPTVDHDPVYAEQGSTREAGLPFDIWDYVREGKPVFADSFGDVLRAIECGARVEVGCHVPATNQATLHALANLGASRVWLSPELTLGQIADIADGAPIDLGITVVGAQELMICEHCLLMSQGPCNEDCETCPRRSAAHRLRDRKGFEFPVVTDMLGRSHLYNGIELDIVAALPDLLDIGISSVMVDTTLMSKKEAQEAVARVVRARDLAIAEHRGVAKRPNTTTGHLYRGVS